MRVGCVLYCRIFLLLFFCVVHFSVFVRRVASIHACMCACVDTHYVGTHTCMYMCMCTYILCKLAYMHVYMYTCMYTYILCKHAYIHVYMHVHINTM
jgi:hypothetical protein